MLHELRPILPCARGSSRLLPERRVLATHPGRQVPGSGFSPASIVSRPTASAFVLASNQFLRRCLAYPLAGSIRSNPLGVG